MKYQFNQELANIYKQFELNEGKKPDFLDIDGDGDRTEPLAKAAKEAKSGKKEKRCTCGCIIGKPRKGCKCKKDCKK